MRLLSFVIGLILLLVGLAPAANAAAPDFWGFAFVDKASPGLGFVPSPDHQATSCNQKIVVDQTATGKYTVHFPCDTAVGIPHVTSVDRAGTWCQVTKWAPLLFQPGVDVGVACYLPDPPISPLPRGGIPADSRFSVSLTRSSPSPSLPTVTRYGYLGWTGTAVSPSYNNQGGTNAVGPVSTGEWLVKMANLGSADLAGGIQVTAVNSSVGARCKVGAWKSDPDVQAIVVHCFNASSQPFDTAWTLTYQQGRDIFNRISPLFGYEAATALPPETNFNSVLGLGANSISPGPPDTFLFPQIGKLRDHMQVTAFGDKEIYCQPIDLWGTAADVKVQIGCFDRNAGLVANQPSFATYVRA